MLVYMLCRDTIDSVKQSAALCLLRLLRSSADAIPMSEWSSRIIHLLNDQHMVCMSVFVMVCVVMIAGCHFFWKTWKAE